MNLRSIINELSKVAEIKILGKNIEVGDINCHIIGLTRSYIGTIQLLILQYDPAYDEQLEAIEIERRTEAPSKPAINRMIQSGHDKVHPILPFDEVEQVCIADCSWTVSRSSTSLCNAKRWDKIALFTQFLLSKWDPSGIDQYNIDGMYLTKLTLDGQFDSIPKVQWNMPIHFSFGQTSIPHLVELPVTLTIDGEYGEKLYFKNKISGEEHWVQVNSVTLHDMWTEMESTFDSLQLEEIYSPEEMCQCKNEFEESFIQQCPKGMYYPVIEYECEENIWLQFHSKQWLDDVPDHRSGSTTTATAILMLPDKSLGKLGLPLKAQVIQEPTPAGTETLEVELFQYYRRFQKKNIIV